MTFLRSNASDPTTWGAKVGLLLTKSLSWKEPKTKKVTILKDNVFLSVSLLAFLVTYDHEHSRN